MKVNDIFEVEITDNDINGNGITRIKNLVIFIPFSLKKEIIKIKITKINKKYAEGEIVEIIKPSKNRCKILCPVYNKCGGCNFMHTTIENENNMKKEYLENLFNQEVEYIETNKLGYRNKATFHIKDNKIGFYNSKTHSICEFDTCFLLNDKINDLYKELKNMDLSGINEIMIRSINNKTMINIVGEPQKDIIDNIKCDSIYINNKHQKGIKYLIDEINDLKFSICPDSFYQINREGMNIIYNKSLEHADKSNNLLDLYCGTGTIGIWMHKNFKNVIGYEINESSIKNANINKKLNNINNISFELGDAKDINNKYKFDVIIVDPPRSGLSKKVIEYLNNSKSKKIIYISCNPFTLKRDINLLYNYKTSKITAVNMFLRTKHIESVVLLERKNM